MELDTLKIILQDKIKKSEDFSEIYTICDMGKDLAYFSNLDEYHK